MICGCQVSTSKVESNRDTLAFDGCSIHYFKFIEILSLSDSILARSDDFLHYYAEFHVFDFDPYQIEVYFAQNTVLQVELAVVKFEFNMQTLFYANLHLDRSVSIRFSPRIGHNEFLLFCYPIVISINHHVDVVA